MAAISPSIYFDDILLPTVGEYESDPTNVRRAMLACIAAYHIVDVVAVATGKEPQFWFDEFYTRCPEFNTVKAVALVAKHIEPTQSGFKGLTPESITIGRAAAFSDGSYFSDGTSWAESEEVVVLQSEHLPMSDVAHALNEVTTFLRRELAYP